MVRRFVALSLGVALSTLGGGVSAHAASSTPIFTAHCPVSHRSADDPIVHPNMRGHAHNHDFSGNWTARFDSTYESMLSAGQLGPGTTCDPKSDLAGYWVPTFYDPAGAIVENTASTAYYVPGKYGAKNLGAIKPFPANLKIVADMAKSAVYGSGWHCGDAKPPSSGGTLNVDGPPDCRNRDDGPGGIFPDDTRVQAKIVFPDCWNGVTIDSADHRSHMAYSGSAGCPSTHPVSVPRLNMKVQYDTFGGPGFTLSSGATSTMHADFWNTWVQAELEKRVKHCLNEASIHDTSTDPCTNDGSPGPQPVENPYYPEAALAPASDGAAPQPDTGTTDPDHDHDTTEPEPEPEPAPAVACADSVDNDTDGRIDAADPGCSSSSDDDETDPVTEAPAPTGSWSLGSLNLGLGDYREIPDVLGLDDSYTLKVSYTGLPTLGKAYLMHVGNSMSNRMVIYVEGTALRAAVTVDAKTKTLTLPYSAGLRYDIVVTRDKRAVVLYVGGVRRSYTTSAAPGAHDLGTGAVGAQLIDGDSSGFAPGIYHSASVNDGVLAP